MSLSLHFFQSARRSFHRVYTRFSPLFSSVLNLYTILFMTGKRGKRFELKKWNAVALWTWDIGVDTCAICRNNIMDMCIEAQANPDGALGNCFFYL